jgi:nicotinamidase-related amidase
MSQPTDRPYYADPANPVLPSTGFQLNREAAALVVVDPQNDFLSPKGVTWPFVGECITENNTVGNLLELFKSAKAAGITVAVSPHYYYPTDHAWEFGGPLEKLMHQIGMFGRAGSLSLEDFEGSGADFYEDLKPYIQDGKTILASPHKIYGPETNDLILQLRKRGVSQVILAGMAANLCIEGHLRELVEQGFEVVVVRDATAAPRAPEGDGYLAALINFRFIAHALWTTREIVAELSKEHMPVKGESR